MAMAFYGIKVSISATNEDLIWLNARESKVVFRMVIFRPFTSEVIMATVRTSDEDGIRRASFLRSFDSLLTLISSSSKVHMEFFDDIHIPAMYLPQPCALYDSLFSVQS
jgi:DNA-directed RNA polymerase subunit E'/Rpb7